MDRYSLGEFLVSSSLLFFCGISPFFPPFVVASGVESFWRVKGSRAFSHWVLSVLLVVVVFRRGSVTGEPRYPLP
jgi:hypothetical protein